MYAVSLDELEISPSKMKFEAWWIYNFNHFHPFLIEKIKRETHEQLFFGSNVWEALLKAYDLSLFSPMQRLQAFAEDYHHHSKSRTSHTDIKKVFQRFHHLGLDKIGHLKRIPNSQIHSRFGKVWSDFLRGILYPEIQNWKWISYKTQNPIEKIFELDFSICEVSLFFELIKEYLEIKAKESRPLFFEKIEISWMGMQEEGDAHLQINFPRQSCLQKDLAWIQRVLQERLSHIELQAPITKFKLLLHMSPGRPPTQLSLFEDSASSLKFESFCQKMKSMGHKLFVPEIQPTFIPEKSWIRAEPHSHFEIKKEALLRPLIQFPPKPIQPPQSKLYPSEIISWHTEDGRPVSRHYYICRSERKWIWIFQDQNHQWFEQGVLE